MPSHLRTLVVMRHAKAEQAGPSDRERVLAARGHDDAADLGRRLADVGVRPDHALVSTARRTEQTYADVAAGARWDLAPDLEDGLYAAGVDTALDLVRLVAPAADTLVVVGHNPTVSYLAQLLDDGEGDAEAAAAMVLGFPTGAAAVFAVDGAWADLAPGTGRLTGYHVGRARGADQQ